MALEAFKEAYILNNDDDVVTERYVDSLLNLIADNLNKKRLKTAGHYLEEALLLKKNGKQKRDFDRLAGQLYAALGNNFMKSGEFEDAKNAFDKSLEFNPEEVTGHMGLARYYHRLAMGMKDRKIALKHETRAVVRIMEADRLCKGRCINARIIKRYRKYYENKRAALKNV